MINNILVEQFCTPPQLEENDLDRKAFDGAKNLDIKFEGRILKGYTLGEGRNILLVHGWGSRASHLVLPARYLAANGFRAVLFDGPAHGNSKKKDRADLSDMFEFGRAISFIAKYIGNIYAVIGHSFGASTVVYTMTGTSYFSQYSFEADKLIVISAPGSFSRLIENYTRNRNETDLAPELIYSLEHVFGFKVSDYNLSRAIQLLRSRLLIIHDEQDDEIPVADALMLKEKDERFELKLTKGYGHQKILVNREMLHTIKEFLMG